MDLFLFRKHGNKGHIFRAGFQGAAVGGNTCLLGGGAGEVGAGYLGLHLNLGLCQQFRAPHQGSLRVGLNLKAPASNLTVHLILAKPPGPPF